MVIVDKILQHPKYMEYMKYNAEAETERQFCRHDLQHCLDVARVAYIMNLENSLGLDKDVIYAAALLHDIAKWKQYRYGIDHAAEGAVLAAALLKEIMVDEQTTNEITEAIRTHRKSDLPKSPLGKVLYDSDKSCRPCVFCDSIDGCNRFKNGNGPTVLY